MGDSSINIHHMAIEQALGFLGLTDATTEEEAKVLLDGCECNGEEGLMHLIWHLADQRDKARKLVSA